MCIDMAQVIVAQLTYRLISWTCLMKSSKKSSGVSQPAARKNKCKCSGGSHSARTSVKRQHESTGMSYIKTAYVGITKKVNKDSSIRYRVRLGRKFIASGKMTLAEALAKLQKASKRQIKKKQVPDRRM